MLVINQKQHFNKYVNYEHKIIFLFNFKRKMTRQQKIRSNWE